MLQRAQIFLFDAGKTILMISLVLWVLSYFGPGSNMATAKTTYEQALQQPQADSALIEKKYAQQKLEGSYMGIMGKAIEPAIKPIGYDWKIGISLLTSFAAREVFVGTMATLYSVDGEEDTASLKDKMNAATFKDGSKVYTLATGISLLIFYAIALQCMSTFATVKRELKSWQWATVQLVGFTALAYVLAFVVYRIFL
jgi:ferrous iron transport protein B